MSDLNVSKMSDEDIQNIFTEAYEEQVATWNSISEFEAICRRDVGSSDVTMEVTIVGMAEARGGVELVLKRSVILSDEVE